MNRHSLRSALLALFVAMITIGTAAAPSHADSGTISIEITKVGFVAGVTGGSGTLQFQGRSYDLSIGGLSLGLTVGISTARLNGTVTGLGSPGDIEGSYLTTSASASVVVGADNLVLTNARGVRLELRGHEAGFEASLDAGGMSINLK